MHIHIITPPVYYWKNTKAEKLGYSRFQPQQPDRGPLMMLVYRTVWEYWERVTGGFG